MDPKEINVQFFSLVSMLSSACWQQLGKMPDQTGGGMKKDLKGAKSTIELFLMLRDKTRGNLTGTEEKLLNEVISTLQQNYEEASAQDGV